MIESIAWDFALQAKKSAVEFTATLKDYQEQQKAEHAPLDEQINEVKNLVETAKRRIKRLASLVGSANDDDEAAQYQHDLDSAKSEKIGLERKLKKLEANYHWEDTITDDDIIAVLEMRKADIENLQKATFEDMRRYLTKIDLRIEISNRVAEIKCQLPIPVQHLELDQSFELCAASSIGS